MLHDTKELESLKGDTKNETSEMEQFHLVYIEPSMRRAGKVHLFCLALVLPHSLIISCIKVNFTTLKERHYLLLSSVFDSKLR